MHAAVVILLWSVVLGFAHIFAAAIAATSVRGPKWNLSARDEPVPALKGVPGRLDRATQNFKETFPLFAACVLAGAASGRLNETSVLGAQLYFWSRVAYLPLYAFGVPVARTLAYLVSVAGIALILYSVLIA